MQPITYFVMPGTRGGWDVKKQGGARATRRFVDKQQAIEYGEALHQRTGARLVVLEHRKREFGYFAKYVIYADPQLWDEDMND